MKFIIVLLMIVGWVAPTTAAQAEEKKVLMLISTGFYAPEYFKPREIFERAGFQVQVAAKYDTPVIPDQRQVKEYPSVKPDVIFSKVDINKYDAIVFSGGNGAWEDFFPNEDVHKILSQSLEKGKKVALLCSATGLLGVANNLDGKGKPLVKGKKVTGYKRVRGLLEVMGGVQYLPGESGKPFVVVDGNLITGRDPISSELFGRTVVEHLK